MKENALCLRSVNIFLTTVGANFMSNKLSSQGCHYRTKFSKLINVLPYFLLVNITKY